MKRQISSSRISSISLLLEIVKESPERTVNFESQVRKLEKKLERAAGDEETFRLEREFRLLQGELAKSSLITIVFSTMALEAYMYDYAARNLGDAFVKDHLDKLDTLSKWIVIPELITGSEMPRHQKWFGLLKNLIKARNSIVHHKSSDIPASPAEMQEYLEKEDANSKFIYETAAQSVQLLKRLADKIAELDPNESAWVNSYFK